jgi:hypothetical protein
MPEELQLRNYADFTIRHYLDAVRSFARAARPGGLCCIAMEGRELSVIRRPHGVPDLAGWRGPLHFFLTTLAEPLAERTCARRCAVRFRAAAVAAFFARAARSSAVMFFAAFLPP